MFEKLLLAIDASAAGEVATDFAAAYARRCSASVHVLHVNEHQIAGNGLTLLSKEEATALIGAALLQLREAGVRAGGSVQVAHYREVATRIAEAAQCRGVDAIVLGSQRHRGLARLFSARVRDRTTRLSSLPVLTAPSPLNLEHRAHLRMDEWANAKFDSDWVRFP